MAENRRRQTVQEEGKDPFPSESPRGRVRSNGDIGTLLIEAPDIPSQLI